MIVIFMINIIVTRFCDRSSRIVSLSFCTQCHLSLLLCRRPHRSIQKQKCRNTKTNTCWLPHRLLLIPNLQIISPSTSTIHKRSWPGNHLPAPPGLHHSVLWQEKASCYRLLTDHQTSSQVISKTHHRLFGWNSWNQESLKSFPGIAICGSGIGTFIFAPLTDWWKLSSSSSSSSSRPPWSSSSSSTSSWSSSSRPSWSGCWRRSPGKQLCWSLAGSASATASSPCSSNLFLSPTRLGILMIFTMRMILTMRNLSTKIIQLLLCPALQTCSWVLQGWGYLYDRKIINSKGTIDDDDDKFLNTSIMHRSLKWRHARQCCLIRSLSWSPLPSSWT